MFATDMVPETLDSQELLGTMLALKGLPVAQSVLPELIKVCEGQATVTAHGLLVILKAVLFKPTLIFGHKLADITPHFS